MAEKTPAAHVRERFATAAKPHFKEIEREQLPEAVLQKVGVSMQNVERVLKTDAYGVTTYVCVFRPDKTATKIFFVDCGPDNSRLGFAILDFDTGNPTFGPSSKPYTNYTSTEAKGGQGWGTARLWTMNAYALSKFNDVMYSGSRLEPGAEAMWRRLVAEGYAEQVPSEIFKSKYRIKKV